jgi:hypothetical protein
MTAKLVLVVLLSPLVGCATSSFQSRSPYLDGKLGSDFKDEVVREKGPPAKTWKMQNGNDLWIYSNCKTETDYVNTAYYSTALPSTSGRVMQLVFAPNGALVDYSFKPCAN